MMISVAFALAVATSAEAMPVAPLHEPVSPIGVPFSALRGSPPGGRRCLDFPAQMNLVLSMLFDAIEDR